MVAVLAGRHPEVAVNCTKNKTTIKLCSMGALLCFLIGTSGDFNNIVCPIVHHAWWPHPAHCLQVCFLGGKQYNPTATMAKLIGMLLWVTLVSSVMLLLLLLLLASCC